MFIQKAYKTSYFNAKTLGQVLLPAVADYLPLTDPKMPAK